MESAEARINRRAQAVQQAEERAHRIASVAAEALVRSQGVSTPRRDEYLIASGEADPHVRDCIEHLVWHGYAVSHEREHGHLAVQLGDFTLGGGTEPDRWGAGYEAGYAAGMAEPNRAQKMRDAGYTRRPTLREMAEPQEPPIWEQLKKIGHEALEAGALAEPAQEPVAWRTFDGEGGYDYRTHADNEDYAAEWAKRNPQHVGWVEPLYIAPPQRKPLTQIRNQA